jgi:PAP2 superfamily
MTEIPVSMPGISPRRQYFPPALRVLAQFFSYVFHPLFISTYVIGFLIFFHPYVFEGFDEKTKVTKFLSVAINTALFPVFAVFLTWRLQFISSMHLGTAKERIIPYMIAMILYFWAWWVFKNVEDIPPVAIHFLLGAFLAICCAWFANIYYKISMHAIAMGGMAMFFFLLTNSDKYPSGIYLSVALLIAGIVCTARLICSDHTPFQVWSGLFLGFLSQWIAWQF